MESHNKSTGRLWYGCLGWSRSLHSLHAARPVSTAGPQTSTEYLRAHTSNQVTLTSHRPGSQTVSFWYVNLSFRTKHKEYASNLLLCPIILPEHLSSSVKIRVSSSAQQRLFFPPEMRYISLRWNGFEHVYCGQWRFGKVLNQCWNVVNANTFAIFREEQTTHRCHFSKEKSSRGRSHYWHFFFFVKISANCWF